MFNHSYFGNVRMVEIKGKAFAIGNDVAKSLGYARPYEAVSSHCKGAVSCRVPTEGGIQEVKAIPEGDIYRLIVKASDQSKNETIRIQAKQFEKWIFEDVLPSIRKNGMFAADQLLDNPDFAIQVFHRLKEERTARLRLQSKIEHDRPLVLFAESLQVSGDSILVADLAKLLKQNGIDMGEIRLFKYLRENGYLVKSGSEYNMPTQRSMDLKIMEIRMGHRGSSDGTVKITRTPKITGKGQIYFINKFKAKEIHGA